MEIRKFIINWVCPVIFSPMPLSTAADLSICYVYFVSAGPLGSYSLLCLFMTSISCSCVCMHRLEVVGKNCAVIELYGSQLLAVYPYWPYKSTCNKLLMFWGDGFFCIFTLDTSCLLVCCN